MKFYLATHKQENAKPVRDVLVKQGHVCTATWIDEAGYGNTADAARANAATTCEREVREADMLILIAEPDGSLVRGGKHVETGMALAWGKPVFVLGKRENVFHWHPRVTVCATVEELIHMAQGGKESNE